MLKIFIPSNRPCKPGVLESIQAQGVLDQDIHLIDCRFDINIPKRIRIPMAKEKCRVAAMESKSDYVVFTDTDILHLRTNNFTVMKEFLDKNADYGAVSCFREDFFRRGQHFNHTPNHKICMSCAMIRREALPYLSSGNAELPCTCVAVAPSLRSVGWKFDYVDLIPRIRELGKVFNGICKDHSESLKLELQGS